MGVARGRAAAKFTSVRILVSKYSHRFAMIHIETGGRDPDSPDQASVGRGAAFAQVTPEKAQ
jgi:hypothetical protein